MSINANNHDVHPYSPACRRMRMHFPFHLLLSAALHIELSTWTRTVITMVVMFLTMIMMTLPCHLDIKDIDVDNMMKITTTMLIMTVVIMN